MADAGSVTNENHHHDHSKYHNAGGPHGLGDPEDTRLRVVERDIVIPKLIKTKSQEKCADKVAEFQKCGVDNGFLLPFKCRKQNNTMNECLLKWYNNEELIALCTKEYLADRSEYRRTGITKKQRRKDQVML